MNLNAISGPQGMAGDVALYAAAMRSREVKRYAEEAHWQSTEHLTAFVRGYESARTGLGKFLTRLGWLPETPQVEAYRSEITRRSDFDLTAANFVGKHPEIS